MVRERKTYTEEEVNYLFSKGAPERLLPKCTRILTANGEVDFDDEREDEIKYQFLYP